MSMRFKLPPGGDVPPSVAARRLGLSLEEFRAALPKLQARNPPFPSADPDTGNFDLDAIEQWRKARFPHLFSSALTSAPSARDATLVVGDRLRRMRGDG